MNAVNVILFVLNIVCYWAVNRYHKRVQNFAEGLEKQHEIQAKFHAEQNDWYQKYVVNHPMVKK